MPGSIKVHGSLTRLSEALRRNAWPSSFKKCAASIDGQPGQGPASEPQHPARGRHQRGDKDGDQIAMSVEHAAGTVHQPPGCLANLPSLAGIERVAIQPQAE